MADAESSAASTSSGKHEAPEVAASGSAAEQHPALAGDPAAEVDARSADGSKGTVFAKTFVMAGEFAKDHPVHEHNCIRVLEEAIQRGLHPKGEAKLVKTEKVDESRRGVVSTACTYSVNVEPAITDDRAHETVTPSSAARDESKS